MTKRLQVLLDDDELRVIQGLARTRRMTTAAWVRASLRTSVEAETRAGLDAKLAAIRRAAAHALPTADVDVVLADIDRGDRAIDEA